MSVTPTLPASPSQPRPKLLPTKANERFKLAAAALDRLSTVVVGGALLAPIFQHQDVELRRLVSWAAAAVLLHAGAQFMLTLLQEEA